MSVHLDPFTKNSSLERNISLPNNFEISPDGKTAVKYCIITDEAGRDKKYSFRIKLSQQDIKSSKYELLKTFTDAKVLVLVSQSISLGLGRTFSGVGFSYGKISKMHLKKYDGGEEVVDSKELTNKELELSNEKNLEKKTILQRTIRAFRTVEYAVKDAVTGNSLKSIEQNDIQKKKVYDPVLLDRVKDIKALEREFYEKKLKLIEVINDLKEDLKNMYKDNVLVQIYYSNIYENIDRVSIEDLKLFYKESSGFDK